MNANSRLHVNERAKSITAPGTNHPGHLAAIDLKRLTSLPFDATTDVTLIEIRRRFESLTDAARGRLREQLRALTGYAIELTPVIMQREVFDLVEEATRQWVLTAVAFLKDVYESANPAVVAAFPQLRHMISSSPQFSREIVGTPMAKVERWDISMAMDWQLSCNPDGTYSISVIEGGAGSVGGLERTAFVARAMTDTWNSVCGFERFEDNTTAIRLMIEQNRARAVELGGIGVNLQELDHPNIFGRDASHPFRVWLEGAGTPLLSTWNLSDLQYDANNGYYIFDGRRVASFWLQYYPAALDPTMPSYAQLGDIYKTSYEMAHAIPGFWQRYIYEEGYRRWRVLNPLGTELMSDKAILAFMPEMIRFYLGQEPLIESSGYGFFIDRHGTVDVEKLDEVFSDPGGWVIKSRIDNREGLGVFVGPFMSKGEVRNGLSWRQLRECVECNPAMYVYQKFFQEQTIDLPHSGRRAVEVRNIGWTIDGRPYSVGVPYMRSCPVGSTRNLTGQAASSIIPVLIPRRYVGGQ